MLAQLKRHPSLRILAIYVLFVTAWIVYFDALLPGADLLTPERLLQVHAGEDIVFAIVTCAMLFLLLRAEFARRRRIEDALRKSEELFHALARLSPVGIFRSGNDGRCSYVNESWTRITGIEAGRALGEGWASGVHPADREAVLGAWRRCVTDSGSTRIEYRFQRPDGTVAWVLGEVHPERTAAHIGFVGSITDITDRKQIELALRTSEERFRTLIEHMPAVACTRRIDPRGSPVFVSPQVETMLGYTPAEWVGDAELWFRSLHPEDQPRVLIELMDPVREHVQSEYRLRHKSGRWIRVVEEAAFLYNEANRPIYRLCLLLDVTQTRQLASDLARTHGRYEGLVNSLDGIVWEMDAATFAYTFVSRQAERLTGVPLDRWLQEPDFWLEHIHPADRERARNAYREAMRTLRPTQVEYRMVAAENREIWIRDGIVAAPEGEGIRLRGVMVDISASRRAAQEIQELNAELETRVRQRTAELESANEEMRSFSYSVSHDLRVPLRTIAATAEALNSGYSALLDAAGRDHLGRLSVAAQRMGQLIEDLLNLSRVNRAELRREPVDLGEVAQSVMADFQRVDPGRKVQFRFAPGLCVVGDAQLLRLLLENLLGNAWKFTSRKPEALIELGVQRGAGGHHTYFVRDNGAGFDMEFAGKLFRPFQRLHDSTEFPGTGIGLATVHRIVSRHGGRVFAEGKEGAGATFYFEL